MKLTPPPITAAPWRLHEPYSVLSGTTCQSVRTPDHQWLAHIPRRAVLDPERDAIAQAIAALPQCLEALSKLLELSAKQLDQSATHDGLENCKVLASARYALLAAGYKVEGGEA